MKPTYILTTLLICVSELACINFKFGQDAEAAPVRIGLENLDYKCREAIRLNRPPGNPKWNSTYPVYGPDIYVDDNNDISIGWRSLPGQFYPSDTSGEMNAARAIGAACPRVVKVVFSGSTGGSQRWYIRRNKFTIRHSRDSGYPGDYDLYWAWDKIPFNYDPNQDYGPYGPGQ